MFLCEIVLLWSCPSGSMWDTHCFRLTVFHCISQLICWLQTSWRQKPWHVVRFLSPGCPRLLTHSGIKWCHPQGQSCRSCLCAQQTKIDSEMWEHNSQGQQVTAERWKQSNFCENVSVVFVSNPCFLCFEFYVHRKIVVRIPTLGNFLEFSSKTII